MKLRPWIMVAIVGTVLFALFYGAKAQAWTAFKSGSSATVASGQTLNSSLWAGGRNIDIAGTVNGDVFCGGQNVNISGIVKGDVICGAQTVNISGTVEGDVRIGAQTVNLDGSVGRNATIAAQTINTESKSKIGGDASFAANMMNIDGSVGRDMSAAGATINLNGSVGRDMQAKVGHLTLGSSAKVNGSVDYTSENAINMQTGANVSGKVTQKQPTAHKGRIPSILFLGAFAFFLAIILIVSAVIITALLPQLVHRVSEEGVKSPWMSLLTGFVASIAVPIFIFMLVITVVGIPIAILAVLAWLLINLSSGLFSAYYLGRQIWRTQHNPIWIILLGSILLLLLYMIPFVGILALALATWLGQGMILRTISARTPKPNYNTKS